MKIAIFSVVASLLLVGASAQDTIRAGVMTTETLDYKEEQKSVLPNEGDAFRGGEARARRLSKSEKSDKAEKSDGKGGGKGGGKGSKGDDDDGR